MIHDDADIVEAIFGMLAEDLSKPLTPLEQVCIDNMIRLRESKHNRRYRRRFRYWEAIYSESRFGIPQDINVQETP